MVWFINLWVLMVCWFVVYCSFVVRIIVCDVFGLVIVLLDGIWCFACGLP